MACAQMETISEPDRHKRFKSSGPQHAGPAIFSQVPAADQTDAYQVSQHVSSTAAAEPGPSGHGASSTPDMLPSATTAAKANPMALPAASQQYPVLPQAAASAAAAAAVASALQSIPAGTAHPGIPRPTWAQGNLSDNLSSAGKKQSQAAELQQQRRRAGPVNQWRPGMPLLIQQPVPTLPVPAPHQQLQHWSAQQQQQYVRPSGAVAAGATYQAPQGGALAAALQNLLPLPGQLMAAQQRQQQQQQQQQQGRQMQTHGLPALHILQGTPTALPPNTSVLVPSAPLAPLNRTSAGCTAAAAVAEPGTAHASSKTPAAAAAAAAAAARISAAAAPAPAAAAAAGAAPAARCVPGVLGVDLNPAGSPEWLKLLSCAVDQEGDSMALELLLGGQLYKGQLTRVTPAQAAAPAAAAAAAAAPAGAGCDGGQQGAVQVIQQVLSDADRASLLGFAQQREGMCFLCALPFTKQGGSPMAAGPGGAAAALQAAAVNNEAGAVAPAAAPAAAAPAAAAVDQAGICLAEAAPGTAKSELALKQEQQQEQQAAGAQQQQQQQQQQQGSIMSCLGPAVAYDLGEGCSLMLHQACAEATAKAADLGQRPAYPKQQQQQQQQQEQQMVPPAQLLLACLSNHCCGCDQRAAMLQCLAPGCSKMFHVPCVQGMGALVLQDGSCWCSEHQDLMTQYQQYQQAQQQQHAGGPFAAASATAQLEMQGHAEGAMGDGDGLSSPEPSKPAGINPSPSFAAALVLQQMRCSKGCDILLDGTDSEPGSAVAAAAAADSSSGAGSKPGPAVGATRSSAQRRLLEAMPVSNSSNGSSMLASNPWQHNSSSTGRGLYDSTAEASRQYHLQHQQQQGAYGTMPGPAASAPGPATTLLLQRLQAQSGQASWQQQQSVGPTRRSPKSGKGRPPLHAPPGKAKGGWKTLGLISAFALAQQQEETQQEQQQQQQQAVSHAAAAAVAVSGPTVVVPRVRARKGAMHTAQL